MFLHLSFQNPRQSYSAGMRFCASSQPQFIQVIIELARMVVAEKNAKVSEFRHKLCDNVHFFLWTDATDASESLCVDKKNVLTVAGPLQTSFFEITIRDACDGLPVLSWEIICGSYLHVHVFRHISLLQGHYFVKCKSVSLFILLILCDPYDWVGLGCDIGAQVQQLVTFLHNIPSNSFQLPVYYVSLFSVVHPSINNCNKGSCSSVALFALIDQLHYDGVEATCLLERL